MTSVRVHVHALASERREDCASRGNNGRRGERPHNGPFRRVCEGGGRGEGAAPGSKGEVAREGRVYISNIYLGPLLSTPRN